MKEDVSFHDVLEAYKRIKSSVFRTPLYHSVALSKRIGVETYLKLECFQLTGAFKIRGAINKIYSLSKSELRKGLVTASSGNHGLAVSYAAKLHGSKATIVVPEKAVEEKIRAIQDYGAKVIKHGRNYDEAYVKALEIQKESGATFVHPFNDPLVIAGQGTIGLELLEDIPDIDTIIVPIGGGGLISGVSIAAKTLKPHIRIVGVQPEGAQAAYLSWKAGEIVEVDAVKTVADGLAAKKPLELTFNTIKRYVDEILLVSDEEIGEAVLTLLNLVHVLAEPSGAASTAALLSRYKPEPKEKVAVIVTGANISINYLASLLTQPKPTV